MAKATAQNMQALKRQLNRLVEEEQDRLPSAGSGIEKRRHDRHLYMVEAKITYVKRFNRLSDCPDEFTVYTKDLSRSGVSFLYEHEMFLDEIIKAELKLKENEYRTLLLRVTRCRRAGLKVFNIAGEFVSEEELEGGESQAQSDTPDLDADDQ